MGVLGRVKQLVSGGEAGGEPAEDQEPSHVCESCGEEYYTSPDTEISTCRACGGVKVEPA